MNQRFKIMTVFGTRPEAIKMAPVIHELERRTDAFQTINVSSGQHRDLLPPLIKLFRLRVDYDLEVHDHETDEVSAAVIRRLLLIIKREKPDMMLVQGDTSTAVGAAAAGSATETRVGHIEAGLRSGDEMSPFPEEIYRKRIAALASLHFAPTLSNRRNLLSEGIPNSRIFVTGNTVVDSLNNILEKAAACERIDRIVAETAGLKRIVMTMHRRENLPRLAEAFLVLKRFVAMNNDVCVLFPVHPNPVVRHAAHVFRNESRIRLLEPLEYVEFVQLLQHAWIVLTDSGGIQEEAPTLGKTVLLFRAKSERPEAMETDTVRIIGNSPGELLRALESFKACEMSREPARFSGKNPFGSGGSAKAIVDIVERLREGLHEPAGAPVFQPA